MNLILRFYTTPQGVGKIRVIWQICGLKLPAYREFNIHRIIKMHYLQGLAVVILYLPRTPQLREYPRGKQN